MLTERNSSSVISPWPWDPSPWPWPSLFLHYKLWTVAVSRLIWKISDVYREYSRSLHRHY